MKMLFLATLGSILTAIVIQMVLPFPYGVIFGIAVPVIVIWKALQVSEIKKFSLLRYRRIDPKNEKEVQQNKKAYRILKKKFLEGKITQEEFDKLTHDFEKGEKGNED